MFSRPFFPIAAAATALLVGCASDFPRPTHWGPLAPLSGPGCPEIDGAYDIYGESSYPWESDNDRKLSVRLLRSKSPENAAHIHLRLAGEAHLEVTVLDHANTVLYSSVLDSQGAMGTARFACSEGVLWLHKSVEVKKDGTGVGRNDMQFGLALARDGALIGVERSAAVALIGWMVPVALSEDIWFRWRPVSPGPS